MLNSINKPTQSPNYRQWTTQQNNETAQTSQHDTYTKKKVAGNKKEHEACDRNRSIQDSVLIVSN
jgi:hypothetical protein